MTISSTGENDLSTLGGRIKAVRVARGLALGETAAKMALSRTSLTLWEANNVANPDPRKLGKFCKITDVSLDWLVQRTGNDPEFLGKDGVASPLPVDMVTRSELRIPEIMPGLEAHAKSIDKTARSFWSLPTDALELGFDCNPAGAVIKRIASRDAREFGVERGDYVLIDSTRTKIDEPGLYLLADPDGISARRALVETNRGKPKIVALGDDTDRSCPLDNGDNPVVLGRVMGIFKPV